MQRHLQLLLLLSVVTFPLIQAESVSQAPKPVQEPVKEVKKTVEEPEDSELFMVDPLFDEVAAEMAQMRKMMDDMHNRMMRSFGIGQPEAEVAKTTEAVEKKVTKSARKLLRQELDNDYVILTIAVPVAEGEKAEPKIKINGYKRKLTGSATIAGHDLKLRIDEGHLLSVNLSKAVKKDKDQQYFTSFQERSYVEPLKAMVNKLDTAIVEFDDKTQELTIKLPRDKELERERFGVELQVKNK